MNVNPLAASIALAIAAMSSAQAGSSALADADNSYRTFSCLQGKQWSSDASACIDAIKTVAKSAPVVVAPVAAPVVAPVVAPAVAPVVAAPVVVAPDVAAPVVAPVVVAPVVVPAVVSNESRSVLYLPTGMRDTSAMMIERIAPNQVVAGQPFSYNIKATNLTPGPLSNVAVQDLCSSNFKMLTSTPVAERIGDSHLLWRLGDMKAGESRVIDVNGQVVDANKAQTCLSANYDQASCLAFNVVQPQLTLKASAPAEVIRCDAIPLSYSVANPGTGAAQNATFTQSLPEGISLKDGDATSSLGELAPGAIKDIKLSVMAAKPGVYEFHPAANAAPGLKADAVATTRVTQPALQVSKQMVPTQYLGRNVDYDITVSNSGDAIARNLVVDESVPSGAKVNSVSDNGHIDAGHIVWNLADLAPKQSQTVKVSLQPQAVGEVATSTQATAYCADAANAMGKTAVVGIPAILLEVVDLTDPVEVGKETTYVITATNQGTAMDTNIHIVADLESSMQLVSAGGATEAVSTGGRINFAPLPKLEPGAKAEWRVTGKAVAPADSRFTTVMTTDELQRPVMETEATTLYK